MSTYFRTYLLKFGDYVVSLDIDTNTPISTKNGELKVFETPLDWFAYSEDKTTITGFSDLYNEKYSSITDIVIPSEYSDGTKITTIGENAFEESNITSAIISDGVTVVDVWSFTNSKIKKLSIPNSVTKIGNAAFAGTKITELTIPKSVTEIGQSAFVTNKNLKTVIFEEGSQLKKISSTLFAQTGITSIKIPASVETIESYAISDCDDLTEVVFEANSKVKVLDSTVFARDTNLSVLTFESGRSKT